MWKRYVLLRSPFARWAKMKKYNLKVSGIEHIPREGPFIVIANHQSVTDVIGIALALEPILRKVMMVPWAKKEIVRFKDVDNPIKTDIGAMLYWVFNMVPIDRDRGNIEEAISKSAKHLAKGRIICIFPEGTRQKDRELGGFEYGIINLLRIFPVDILPIGVYRRSIDGGIQVNIGEPFSIRWIEKYEHLEEAERFLARQIDNLRKKAEKLPPGIERLEIIKRIKKKLPKPKDVKFKRLWRMGKARDVERLRNEIFKLLPADWKKVDKRRKKK